MFTPLIWLWCSFTGKNLNVSIMKMYDYGSVIKTEKCSDTVLSDLTFIKPTSKALSNPRRPCEFQPLSELFINQEFFPQRLWTFHGNVFIATTFSDYLIVGNLRCFGVFCAFAYLNGCISALTYRMNNLFIGTDNGGLYVYRGDLFRLDLAEPVFVYKSIEDTEAIVDIDIGFEDDLAYVALAKKSKIEIVNLEL